MEQGLLDAVLRFSDQIAELKPSGSLRISLIEGESLRQAGKRNIQTPYYLQFFSDGSQAGCLNAGYAAGQAAAYLKFRGISVPVLDIVPEWLQSCETSGEQCSAVIGFGTQETKSRTAKKASAQELPCIRVEKEQWCAEILEFIKKQGLMRPEYTYMVFRNGGIHFLLKTTARRHPQQAAVDAGIQIANVMTAAEELWIDLETVKQKEITEEGYLMSVRHKEMQQKETQQKKTLHQVNQQIRYA